MKKKLENEIQCHLEKLVTEIGVRPTGSTAEQAAERYIKEIFVRNGLQVKEQEFPCQVWEDKGCSLLMEDRELDIKTNFFSPDCKIQAGFVQACTLKELEKTQMSGKIVLIYGDLAQHQLLPSECFLYPAEQDHAIAAILKTKKPLAVICVSMKPGGGEPVIADWALNIPSVTIPPETGFLLLDNPQAQLSLEISSQIRESRAANLIAVKKGKSDARITLMAHFDTKYRTRGALDNAGGAAVLLALASRLAQADLQTGLELIAFTDEETFGYADPLYIEKEGGHLGEIITAINMDGAGQRLGANSIMVVSHSEALRLLLDETLQEFPGVVWTDPWPESNHSTFSWRGVPSVAFGSKGVSGLHHSEKDTLEWVDAAKLAEICLLIEGIVLNLQEKTPAWSRP